MLEGRYASVTPRKYEIFPYFSQKHFEICPELCKFALEIRKHFEHSVNTAGLSRCVLKDVLKAIRTMEPAWEKECGRNFSLTSEKVKMPQGGVRLIPVFQLTKTESL